METNPGLILNATSLLHQAIRKALLRNHRYTRLAWHSAAEIDAGSSYPTLVGVSSTGYPIDCKQWLTASHGTIADCRTAGPSRARPQEPFASLPVTHQAFPLHCDSPMVTPTGLTILTPGPCNPLLIEENNRVYLVIYGWEAASETELFTGLQDLPFDIVDASAVKMQRSTQIRNVTCFARNMTNTLWKFLLLRSFKLKNGVTVAMKITLPPPGLVPSYFHTWGVANPSCNEWAVTGIPLAAEEYFRSIGIHLAFNCQKLLPNWIDMITHSGVCDIVFRSKADLDAYRAHDNQWKPFLIYPDIWPSPPK